jgi:hypothetical protein
MKEITHRDEIHGDVEYDSLSVALLDTPTLQAASAPASANA